MTNPSNRTDVTDAMIHAAYEAHDHWQRRSDPYSELFRAIFAAMLAAQEVEREGPFAATVVYCIDEALKDPNSLDSLRLDLRNLRVAATHELAALRSAQPVDQEEVVDSHWIKGLGAPWVSGIPRTDGPPLPSGAVNLETGERRMFNAIRFAWVPSGAVQPDELAALREKHADLLEKLGAKQ